MDNVAADYTVSLHYDRRLYRQDIAGSIAHARMLGRQGIIDEDEAAAIVEGLKAVRKEIEASEFPWRPELEDIHMNVERAPVREDRWGGGREATHGAAPGMIR